MAAPLKHWMYRALKKMKGSRFHRNLRWFEESQYKPFVQLHSMRLGLLERLLHESWHGIPAYRARLEAAGLYDGFRLDMSHWAQLPPLDKALLQQSPDRWTHVQSRQRGMYYYSTGGSTGTPVNLGQDPYYWDWCHAAYFFFHGWSGGCLGEPYFLLWASEQDLSPQQTSFRERFLLGFLQGRRILDCSRTSSKVLSSFIQQINAQTDCHVMLGYAKDLFTLAQFSVENQQPIERPLRAVYSTAEALTPRMRQVMEGVFHCKVTNRYGCRDAGDMACECVFQTGLHINPLYTYLEVVDEQGHPLPDGEEGEILITQLHNYSMPLIRYAVGDRGIRQAPTRCACGREWESLLQITGRTADRILLPDGALFNGLFVEDAFDDLPFLNRYQVHQISVDTLLIKLRSSQPNYVQTYARQLAEATRRLQVWMGHSLQITYEQTEVFDRSPSGKERVVISHLAGVPWQSEDFRLGPVPVSAGPLERGIYPSIGQGEALKN
jgi:phenylacetate-CoA ligase